MPIGLRIISCLDGSVASGHFLGGRTPNPGCRWSLATGPRSSGSSTWSKFKTRKSMSHKVVGERSRGTRRVVARRGGQALHPTRAHGLALAFNRNEIRRASACSDRCREGFQRNGGFDSNPGAEFGAESEAFWGPQGHWFFAPCVIAGERRRGLPRTGAGSRALVRRRSRRHRCV